MKRILCIILAVCLLFALAVPAGAVFADQALIRQTAAVKMLTDLGLISGFSDGAFHPGETVTREQTAKLAALFCTDTPTAEHPAPFTDLGDSWAAQYIAFCAEHGLVSGSGGLFRPKDPVTARELAKMLLAALGYDPTRYTGAEWAQTVDADALRLGIYSGMLGRPDAPVTREDACQLVLGALQANAVSGLAADGEPIFVLDALRNPRSYLEIRFGAERSEGILCANEEGALEGGKTEPGITRLTGYRDSFPVSSDRSLLGRRVNIFTKNGSVLGCVCLHPQEYNR